ncbi:MAG: hypothetical protein KC912_13435 [Proteobacteria bacterium]|nr:hypothetical protein [Pseudomonadota bacterium]
MRTVLLSMLLLSAPALAKKPNVGALSAATEKRPADAVGDLDAAILKAKSDKDLAVLHALRAQALATASLDAAWADTHPAWLSEVLASLRASAEADVGDARALQRNLAVQRVIESVSTAINEKRPLPPETTSVLGVLASVTQVPWFHNLAGMVHLRADDYPAAVLAYRKTVEMVVEIPPSVDSVILTLSSAQVLGYFFGGFGDVDPNEVVALYVAVGAAQSHLSGVSADEHADIERFLVWVPLVLVGLETPEATLAKAQAHLATNPDATIWAALGAYLESQAGGEGAEQAYKKAVEIEPDGLGGRLALGSFYMGQVLVRSQALNELPISGSQEEAKVLTDEIRALNEKARAHLEHAYGVSPDNVTAVIGLVQVCAALEDMEAYKLYKDRLMVLRGQ